MSQHRKSWLRLMRILGLSVGWGSAMAATAGVSQEQADRLGRDLTPVGAIAAGSADGHIPAWVGGDDFPQALKDFKRQDLEDIRSVINGLDIRAEVEQALSAADRGDFASASTTLRAIIDKLPEPQRALAKVAEKQIASAAEPLFTITRDNYQEHADKLTLGHQAMFERYDSYKMHIYPGIRNAFYPDEIYAATKANATRARLEGTDGVKGAKLGFPFPIPTSGAEVIWNHKLKFRGSAVRRVNDQAIVKPDGDFKITKIVENVKFRYANLQSPPPDDNSLMAYYLQEVISPPRVAGQLILVHETADQSSSGRAAWIFNPGLGRVNRAPDVGYDNPSVGTDGEQFNDQVDVFNGSLDRYNWTLVGKREVYIPYNAYLMSMPVLRYRDMLHGRHFNQALARYELHRVWVVEANLREGLRHQIAKRVFYVDEDSWSIAAVANYDGRGQLWKVQEAHLITAPFVPTVTGVPEIIYDLQSQRYFVTALLNEGEIPDWEASFQDSFFSPASLKRHARTR